MAIGNKDRACFRRLPVFDETEQKIAREADDQTMNAGYGKWIDDCIETKCLHHTRVKI
jgi:hypothetical protein